MPPKMFNESYITGERLQSAADISILTPPIRDFHRSLARLPIRCCLLEGDMQNLQLSSYEQLASLQQATTIFVYTHLLSAFFHKIAPRLHRPFVLISHNSDDPVDERFQPYLNSPLLRHWFAQNAALEHEKLTALPIGLANSQWPHGNLELFRSINSKQITKHRLLYMNFTVGTNPGERRTIYEFFRNNPLVTVSCGLDYAAYLEELASHIFCISPPGNGLDCHRIWECLYLGVIPIVKRNPAVAHFQDLPILLIDDWRQITEDFLHRAYTKLKAASTNTEKLDIRYWIEQIHSAATGQ